MNNLIIRKKGEENKTHTIIHECAQTHYYKAKRKGDFLGYELKKFQL